MLRKDTSRITKDFEDWSPCVNLALDYCNWNASPDAIIIVLRLKRYLSWSATEYSGTLTEREGWHEVIVQSALQAHLRRARATQWCTGSDEVPRGANQRRERDTIMSWNKPLALIISNYRDTRWDYGLNHCKPYTCPTCNSLNVSNSHHKSSRSSSDSLICCKSDRSFTLQHYKRNEYRGDR